MSRIKIIYEDSDLAVVDKPAGLVVHSAKGHTGPTLADLLKPKINPAGFDKSRPGIVHRLDKDTSGLLVVAKNIAAAEYLISEFAGRRVTKVYLALVHGRLPSKGIINLPIGRSPKVKTRMSIYASAGKPSVTAYEVADVRRAASLLKINLLTGRTHQIRTHLAAIGHPLIGDSVYGSRKKDRELSLTNPRLFLHSARLEFKHPKGKILAFESKLPPDLTHIWQQI